MNLEIPQALYENVVEQMIISYVKTLRIEDLLPKLNIEALNLLSEIKAILDDDALEDSECFQRINAIVTAFWAKGIYTPRHDD